MIRYAYFHCLKKLRIEARLYARCQFHTQTASCRRWIDHFHRKPLFGSGTDCPASPGVSVLVFEDREKMQGSSFVFEPSSDLAR